MTPTIVKKHRFLIAGGYGVTIEGVDYVAMSCVQETCARIRAEALEEAARVAETHQDHAMGMPQHAAALEIASAIRQLAKEGE